MMTQGSQYLGKLYNDLIANSPQTISMDIPSDMGKGRIAQTKIKHGVILSDWQMCYQADMNVQGTVSKEYMQIIFCLNDGISWGIMDEQRSVTIQKNESCIYAGHGGTEYICYKKDSNFSFKSIKIPLSYFSHLLADYFDGQEVTAYEKKLLGGISKVPVTPIMEQILAETSRFTQYRGGLGYLYLDGKLLELLSIYLGEVLELDILMGKNISMSKTERTAIMEAKRIIDSQLAFAPSCEELSRLVHLSVTKLTRGFSSFYGMPIHQYIIEQRLTQAAQLMDQISMVFQRVYLFQDTIYNNISMGKPDATEEEVYEAAKKARCYDFIMALPDGFQTVVGEGGATLSGGEKQRISIARCILKDAPIVILDEATASVDTDNESYIQEAISELVKGKTLLVIAHRLNTIQNADQILVIDNGQIAQHGTHEELLEQPGIYQDFVNIRKSAAGWSLV